MVATDKTTDYERGLQDAANICAQAAIRQVDRHTAEVLRSMEREILALKETE